ARERERLDSGRRRTPARRFPTSRAPVSFPPCRRYATLLTVECWDVRRDENSRAVDPFHYFHDLRLVRAPPRPQPPGLVHRRPRELGGRALRVPPPGSGQPDRVHRPHPPAAQDPPGGHHPGGLRPLRHLLQEAARLAELPRGGA